MTTSTLREPARAATGQPARRTPPHLRTPFHSATPDLGARKEAFIRGFAVVTLAYGAWYIAWRWSATLNPQALWLSVPLAAAETTALLTTVLLVFNVWRLRRRAPLRPPEGRAVDVFITTYDEPLEIIRKTALAARAIRYAHRTYVLDDGRRFEVRALARELGIGYITRPDNRHAKAGNLNNALRATSGEFILQLDADHVPLPEILDRLLGYMHDPRVAFAQSPQCFYNTDAFGNHVDPETRRFLTDQNIFFSVIQPGKDWHGAAFFCGSCGVLRRAAIEQVGGFSTETITEDIETSLLLHARGWKSAYHSEPLAYGLAPRTATAFHIQRLRWAQGGMQLLRRFNPLTHPGLSLAQRICYVSSALHPLDGLVRLVLVLVPIAYLFTGALAIRAADGAFFIRFLPFIVSFLALHQLLARGTSGPLWFIDYGSMARFFTHTVALFAVLTRRKLSFRVTPKGLNGVSWVSYAPHAAVMVVTAVAVAWGAFAYRRGLLFYEGGQSELPFMVNFFWAAWNFAIAALVLRASIRSHQRRPDHRFDELLPMTFRLETGEHAGEERIGVTENLNARGLAFRSVRPVPVGDRVAFELHLTTGTVAVSGRIVHRRPGAAGRIGFYHHGVEFDGLPRAVADGIELHCTQHAVPAAQARYVERVDPFAVALRYVRDARRERRHPMRLPVQVAVRASAQWHTERTQLGVLEDTSRAGARFLLDEPVPAGVELRFTIPDTGIHGVATAAYCTELRTPFGARYVVGARRGAGTIETQLLGQRNEGKMKKVAILAGLITAARRFGIAALFAALAAAVPIAAAAQITRGVLTGAERDSDGQSLYLLGGWLGGARAGWNPVAGITAYRLEYGDDAVASTVVWAANPYVGLRHQWAAGGVQANVGYSFRDMDDGAFDPSGRQQVTSGLTTGVQADLGADAFHTQTIATYSWGDDNWLWSRLRASQRVAGAGAGWLRAGADLVYQGNDSYHAYEAGPVLEWRAAPGVAVVAGGGWRHGVVSGGTSSDLGYARLELVLAR
jgi:cellulose synthase (UDP-forming)